MPFPATRMRRLRRTPALRRLVSHEGLKAEATAVDLLLRTGGEQRLSDFLLWESAYAELRFTARLWPDFRAADLAAAITDVRSRERRFGTLSARIVAPVQEVAR